MKEARVSFSLKSSKVSFAFAFAGGLRTALLALAGDLALETSPQPSPRCPQPPPDAPRPGHRAGRLWGHQGDSVLRRSGSVPLPRARARDSSPRSELTRDENSFCQLWESWCHLRLILKAKIKQVPD